MKKLLLSLFVIFTLYSLNTAAQEKDLSILVKFGQSDYQSFLSRDKSPNYWGNGLEFSAGIEKRISSAFSIQGLFSYSIQSFDKGYLFYGQYLNDAKNRVYDFMSNMKLGFGVFYFIGGAGLSYQKSDAVSYMDSGYHVLFVATPSPVIFAAKEKLIFAGLLGLGLDFNIYRQINLITEVDMNLREYTGTSLLIGVKYSL